MKRHGLVCLLLLSIVALGLAEDKPKATKEDAPNEKKDVKSESWDFKLTVAKLENDARSATLSDEERHRAAKELALIGNGPLQRYLAALQGLLNDRDPVVRRRGAEGFCHVGPAACLYVGFLVNALKDKDVEVRRLVCQALGQMRALAWEAVPDLVKAYKTDKDLLVRRWAMTALRLIVPDIKRPYPNVDKALPTIKEATKDPNETISFLAKATLKEMEKPFK